MDCPTIIFHIVTVIKGADLGSGLRSRILGVGGSVARASAANVSMIRLTQRSWTAVRTDVSVLLATADTKVSTTAVILTVIWNYLRLAIIFGKFMNSSHLEELLDRVINSSAPHDCFDN